MRTHNLHEKAHVRFIDLVNSDMAVSAYIWVTAIKTHGPSLASLDTASPSTPHRERTHPQLQMPTARLRSRSVSHGPVNPEHADAHVVGVNFATSKEERAEMVVVGGRENWE